MAKDNITYDKYFKLYQTLQIILAVLIASIVSSCNSYKCDQKCIKNKVEEATTKLDELKRKRNDELNVIYIQNKNEQEQELEKFKNSINELRNQGVHEHEKLVRNCKQYSKPCYSLKRLAYYHNWIGQLEEKIKRADSQIEELSYNLWTLNKRIELSGVLSKEQIDGVDIAIAETEIILQEKTQPKESQDVASLEKQIFDKYIRGNSSSDL